jgi:hypothetical protein
MTDSLDTLSKAVGIRKTDLHKIWADVKANHARLDSCPRHSWEQVDGETKTYAQKYVCTACGGTIDSHAKHWYELGLKHAR